MAKLMIIGAGDFQLPLVEKAAEDNEVLIVAPVISNDFRKYATKFLEIDVKQKEKILEFAISECIDGVITDQTDIAVRTVAYVAEKMGLPGIGYDVSCLFTDKSLMRKKMLELGIKCLPNKTVYSLEEAVEYYEVLGGSVIIKPLDTQGSRGVQACSDLEELKAKYAESAKWSRDGAVIVEKLATGREFVVEGISYDYQFENLIIGDTIYFDIPDAFSAKNRIFPSRADNELKSKVLELNRKIITGFGLKQGISHSEFIMDEDEIYLIETAARGGGVFISSDLISLSTGMCTEEFLINIALGEQATMPKFSSNVCSCGYMAFYIPVGEVIEVTGVDEIKSLPYVHHHQLDKLFVGMKNSEKCVDKTSRLAIIVSGKNDEELSENMDYIKNKLVVKVKNKQEIKGLIWD